MHTDMGRTVIIHLEMGHFDASAKYSSRHTRATTVRCTHAPREEKSRVEEGMMTGVVDGPDNDSGGCGCGCGCAGVGGACVDVVVVVAAGVML